MIEDELIYRTEDICGQFTRYGSVFNIKLLNILDTIADINDDLHHDRGEELLKEQVEKAKSLLDLLLTPNNL